MYVCKHIFSEILHITIQCARCIIMPTPTKISSFIIADLHIVKLCIPPYKILKAGPGEYIENITILCSTR